MKNPSLSVAEVRQKNPYSQSDIDTIKARLANLPNGRYEKKRTGKKHTKQISNAEITMDEIFSERDDLCPLLKLNNEYYVIIEEIAKGDFGKMKYAMNLESKEVFGLKTQETFALGVTFNKFNPLQINYKDALLELKQEIFKQINSLNLTRTGNSNGALSEHDKKQIYAIYKQLTPFINSNGEIEGNDAFQYFYGCLPDFIREKSGGYSPVTWPDFANSDLLNGEDIFNSIQSAKTAAAFNLQTASLSENRNLVSEKSKFDSYAKVIKARAEQELNVLKELGRGRGEVIERSVERNIYSGKSGQTVVGTGTDVQFNILMEYVDGPLLSDYIAGEGSHDDVHATSLIARDIVDDWMKLQTKGFYHCDLKSDNVKKNNTTGKFQLIDFGSVSKFDKNTREALIATSGSPFYADEERGYVADKQKPSTEASEVYAMGYIFAELYKFATFNGSGFDWEKPPEKNETPELYAVYCYVRSMIDPDRSKRPSMADVREKANGFVNNKFEVAYGVGSTFVNPMVSGISEKSAKDNVRSSFHEGINAIILKGLNELEGNKSKISMMNRHVLADLMGKFFPNDKNNINKSAVSLQDSINLLSTLFQRQCEKYKRPEYLSFSFFGSSKGKQPINPIKDILNAKPNDHHLTRGVGLILKNLMELSKEDKYKNLTEDPIFLEINKLTAIKDLGELSEASAKNRNRLKL